MKRTRKTTESMRPEYEFAGGVRGKYAQRFTKGSNIIVLDADVAKAFRDSRAVNAALRELMRSARESPRAGPTRRAAKKG